MKLPTRIQHQWILLNYLVFLPWISCQRLNINRNRDEDFPRAQPLQRRSASFRDEDFPLSRTTYRTSTVRGIVFPSQAHRFEVSSNPDFYFDYSRDQRPAGIGRSQSVNLGRSTKAPVSARAEEFSYQEKDKNGPSKWYRTAPQCGGRYQSPIMLNTDSALVVRNKRPLQLVGQTNLPQSIRLQNDGHSAKFTYIWNSNERPYLRGGPLKTKYNFEQFHFHWGSNSTVGSEHVLDSLRFPMELHLVFYNAMYDSFDDARNEVDGLAVVGLFYEIYDDYNEPLNTWTRFLKEVINPETEFNIQFIDTFPLYDLIGDVEWSYFSYEGSLTTPPCLETVTWIVATKPLLITPKEIKEFRRLKSRSGMMVNNFRPVQKLYNRRVFLYYCGCIPKKSKCHTVTMKLRVLILLLFGLGLGWCQNSTTDNGDVCPGRMQSPIEISTMRTTPAMERRPLELINYQEDPSQVTVTNDGHTSVYSFEFPNGQVVTERGGPLKDVYQFASLHFHWGANSARGSEHVLDGRRYAMEMHLVFFNQKYGSFLEARNQSDGLSVLGIFLTNSTTEPNYGWIDALNEVQTAGTSYTLPDPTVFNIKGVIGSRRRPYFSYPGSLTTPPCFESVTWIVQRKTLPISERQLNVFRSLRDANGNPLVDNYREVQPLNGRTVYYYR
ncbi:uncharacterized protein LOC128745420 [Sabethes cyaneus]|uniref:uncharacterized protein LOC128745420 n=1 Tax=Sabethes cyaneus TaxID=53552 RepID=UPI00237DCF2B|nr:uncharacterized protein LOC128745420 [Sabethes cyaneus]